MRNNITGGVIMEPSMDDISRLTARIAELEKHRDHEANIMDCLQAENADLRAQLAAAQERVGELEGERFLLRQILHNIAFFSYVVDGRLHPEYENGWNAAIEKITQDAQKHFTDKGILADDFDRLDDTIAQRDAEIARLEKDQQWLDPGAVELIKAFGSFSIERLPDWNFAVGIDGDVYGIGMTVFDAISSAAAQVDKIKATINDAAITAAGAKGEGGATSNDR